MPRDPKRKVHKDFNEAIYHRPPTGPSFLSTGIIAAIVIVIGIYFAFAKSLPRGSFGRSVRIQAARSSTSGLLNS